MNKLNVVNGFLIIISLLIIAGFTVAQENNQIDFDELSISLQQNYSQDFAFSVLIAEANNVLYSKQFGFRDKKKKERTTAHTLFNIASITKSITAVGICRLVEQNKLNFSDPLGLFFKNAPKPKASISILELLSHQSGLRQSYPLDGVSESAQAVQTIFAEELEFEPGTGFRYSNQNYQLLALIIEEITQSGFETFIRESVFYPLQMEDTYFWDEVDYPGNIAHITNRISRNIGNKNWGWTAATGVFSTAEDLFKFWDGIYHQGFLNEESLNLIFNTYYKTSSGIEIGLGFYKSPETQWNTPELWTRGTESWGHNAVIRYFPERNITIIVTSNSGELNNDSSQTGNRMISDFIAEYLIK